MKIIYKTLKQSSSSSSSFILFSKMEKYSWIEQENTEQGEPGSYEHLHAYSLSNLIQWKRKNIKHKNIKHWM